MAPALQRQGDAGGQAATAAGHQYVCGAYIFLPCLVGNLEAGGRLADDDHGFVVGPDQRQAALRRQSCADLVAIAAGPLIEHDLGTEGAGVVDLLLRGIRRHDDDAGDAVHAGGKGHALGVVAGGEGDDPTGAGLRLERRDRRPAAAELEGAGVLQALGLDEQTPPGDFVEEGRRQQRRPPRPAGQPDAGSFDHCDIDHG